MCFALSNMWAIFCRPLRSELEPRKEGVAINPYVKRLVVTLDMVRANFYRALGEVQKVLTFSGKTAAGDSGSSRMLLRLADG
jgi:hypothetical protein